MPGSSSTSEASEAEAASSEERRRAAEGLGAAAAFVRASLAPLPPARPQLAASVREPSGEGCAAAEKAAKEAAAPEAKRGAGGPLTEEAKAEDAPAEEEAEVEAEAEAAKEAPPPPLVRVSLSLWTGGTSLLPRSAKLSRQPAGSGPHSRKSLKRATPASKGAVSGPARRGGAGAKPLPSGSTRLATHSCGVSEAGLSEGSIKRTTGCCTNCPAPSLTWTPHGWRSSRRDVSVVPIVTSRSKRASSSVALCRRRIAQIAS
mmetsp:Transcript_36838/g.93404  ORF Transcript_36838/g.93404 Transcript_36838/m.93404 type:complete len:260 (-) Transcript_36838:207-986(-)